MSRGTRITPLRLSDELLERIQAAIDSNNARRGNKPYNVTSWIRMAIEERLDKLERGRKGRAAKKAPAEAAGQGEGGPAGGVGGE